MKQVKFDWILLIGGIVIGIVIGLWLAVLLLVLSGHGQYIIGNLR